MICLLITDPYTYEGELSRALEIAKDQGVELFAVFFLSPSELKQTVEELGEKGWLGKGSRRALLASMRSGYRALAEDVLAEVVRKAGREGVKVRISLYEGKMDGLMNQLKEEGCSKILSGSRSLVEPADLGNKEG